MTESVSPIKMDLPTDPSSQSKRPLLLAIVLVSLVGVIISCYPVIFCGRSYASSTWAAMVYNRWPPLPGMKNVPQATNHGSDSFALLVGEIPMGFIESRSVLEYGELPLWNRYSHAGYTLIGQAISMLGDPLQLIVILGHGSAVAWDIKFLCAKLIFCIGFGLLIFRLLGNRLLALIYAGLAAYCGAFFYIYDHPAFFVLSYAPWILLAALAYLDQGSERFVRWGLAWLLVNFACFNAGHVETAIVLIGGLNLAALLDALVRCRKRIEFARIMARIGIGAFLFLGLTAPVWISFLGTLGDSYTSHSEVQVFQFPVQVIIGVFDDLFYQLLRTNNFMAALAPGSSLLVFVGCILSVSRWRRCQKDVFFWINGAGIVLVAGCVFSLVPVFLLAAIPLLNRVGHLRTDLSYLLIIQLTIQSAYGFKCLIETRIFRRTVIDLLCAGAVLAGMVALFCFGGYAHMPVPWSYVLCAATGALGAPLLFAYLRSRDPRIPVAGWVGIIALAFLPHFRFGLYNVGPDTWLMIPGTRAVLNAPSPSIDKIKADNPEPFRIAGLGGNLYGDYAAVYGLEDIRSCAPLSNRELIDLFQNSPGFEFTNDWVVIIKDLVAAQPLLNMLNVKYLFGRPHPVVPPGVDYRLADDHDFGVVENLEVWPRAFYSDKIISISSEDAFIQKLAADRKKPFVALTSEEIEKEPGLERLESTPDTSISPATHFQLLPNSTAFDIHAASAGIVCLTEGQSKDFTATANGVVKQVLTVNEAFKGIYLDQPGDYHIEFIYRPPHWWLSCCLFWSALGLVALLTYLRIVRRTHSWMFCATGKA
ncbi:MAG TPA: hypothetical protein VGI03_07480 [Verrucomicrobiae bacterium]|jgi:hypothetical protein